MLPCRVLPTQGKLIDQGFVLFEEARDIDALFIMRNVLDALSVYFSSLCSVQSGLLICQDRNSVLVFIYKAIVGGAGRWGSSL